MQKVKLLKRPDQGTSVHKLCEFDDVGSSTIYNLKKQKDKLFTYYSDSDTKEGMEKHKHMKTNKHEDLDKYIMLNLFTTGLPAGSQ